MPIRELKDQIARLPEQPGVYLYFNAAGETIYVGKARALRDRVRNYLGAYGSGPKTDALLDEIVRLEVIVTDSVVEALALENNLIKQRSPRYNILLRDDKNYPFLQLTTNEAFPRVLVARRVERDGSFYAGPFMPAHFARRTMSLTHRLFGIRSCNEVITGKRDRPCLEYDIKRCIAPCVDAICPPADYERAVKVTQLFLEGKNDELVKTLRQRMLDAAEGERFEEAAQARDALEVWLTARAGRRVRIVVPQRGEKRGFIDLANRNAALAYQTRFNQAKAAQYDALETLQHVLALPALPRRIECFDISTIQGSETVASMVVCDEGRMRRSEYRKFRIRGDSGLGTRDWKRSAPTQSPVPSPQSLLRRQDDFAAMHEVVLRRYRKLLEHGGPFPDLVVIDGGKGQLSAAYAALEALGLANLVAVGIAKKEELLFTRHHEDAMALAPNDPALLLIQRIRDEAHRFAVTFHRRARTMRDLRSELDHVPGVGARRRKTLLTTFGSVAGVRRATREELAAVVGPKTADAVLAFFASRP